MFFILTNQQVVALLRYHDKAGLNFLVSL